MHGSVGGYVTNETYKSKIKAIKDNIFKIGSVRNAAQFTRSLANIADYTQMNTTIKALAKLEFMYPEMPRGKTEKE